MRKILTSFVFLVMVTVPSLCGAFPSIGNNSWVEATQNNTCPNTSQVAFAYRQKNNGQLIIHQGHLPGGGYPQLHDILFYDTETDYWDLQASVTDFPEVE